MKVCLVTKYGKWSNELTGKGQFALRLIDALKARGVDIVGTSEKADIDLQFGRYHYKPNARKSIIRLGAAHINSKSDYKALNKRKWKSVKQADGVIYQSQFSRKVCRKFIGKPKAPEAVILNGCPEIKDLIHETGPGHHFICATREWLPQKRLKDIVSAFKMADIEGSKLFVCGKTKKKYKAEGVYYTGDATKGGHYFPLLLACHTFVHVTYLDAAPNAVVEALMAGCRVICGSQGGTHELVCGNGPIIQDKPWDFKPINLLKPPKLNRNLLAEAMRMAVDSPKSKVINHHVDIRHISEQYIKFFERILDE